MKHQEKFMRDPSIISLVLTEESVQKVGLKVERSNECHTQERFMMEDTLICIGTLRIGDGLPSYPHHLLSVATKGFTWVPPGKIGMNRIQQVLNDLLSQSHPVVGAMIQPMIRGRKTK